ncbi:hypothetical protein KJ591_02975 [Patescibacteria group bacterium]|nr:hypothetical protein [Patescibacteria group bacterium]
MKFNSVWKVRVPKYLSFLIILLIASAFAFTIVAKAQKRAALIVDENRFFYWKIYENELVFFRFPSNYFIQENNNQVAIFKDELRRGNPELSVWFNGNRAEKANLNAKIGDIMFDLTHSKDAPDYENEFNLIIESVKLKK